MRIQHLKLLRYGKFTDQLLTFPHARQDFHLIVGANEAGKSTTRSAILDLLYGIETRSTLDFLHAKADMRLGASVEHDGAALDFVRTKARTKNLFSASGNGSGSVLAEASLTPFLGSTDRAFFDQMFGLDHTRPTMSTNLLRDRPRVQERLAEADRLELHDHRPDEGPVRERRHQRRGGGHACARSAWAIFRPCSWVKNG